MKSLPQPIVSFLVYLMLTVSLFACSEKSERTEPAKIFGVEPVLSANNVKSYHNILQEWKDKRYRKITVLHISPYDGFAFIPNKRLEAIKEGLTGKQEKAGVFNRSSFRDYLYTASRLGIVGRVYWIIPYTHLEYMDAERRIHKFLETQTSLFSQKDILSMKSAGGCFTGTLFGVETHICSAKNLPLISDPVHITLDADFFPVYAAQRGLGKLRAVKEFFDSIAAKKLLSLSAHVVSGPEIGGLGRYLAEQTVSIIREPALLSKASPPTLWIIRDLADTIFSVEGPKAALSFLNVRIKEYPEDPYLIMMREIAKAMTGDKQSSLNVFESLCAGNRLFCSGMIDAGILLRGKGEFDWAADFIKKSLVLQPDSDRYRFEYARTLYMSGKYNEAIESLSGISDQEYIVSAGFLRGDCSYSMHNESQAVSEYEQAVSLYRDIGGYRLGDLEQKSIGRLKNYYQKRNDQRGMNLLTELNVIE